MTTNLSTNTYRLQNAFRLINDISATNDSNNYYFFVSNFLPATNTALQPVFDINSNTNIQVYNNMLFGKVIGANNVYPIINYNSWIANTVYSMYDDQDQNLPTEAFYVITNEGSFYHVWKILDNNVNSASTVMPTFAQASSTPYYQTADGYRWKYMTSVQNLFVNPYLTSNVFPVIANTTVQNAAIPGQLDIFKILGSGGLNYNNYINGSFAGSDIAVNGDPTQFNLANTQVITVNGYYSGCLLYLTSGVGQGQYANIVSYVSNTTGNIVKVAAPFVTTPLNGTMYAITPQLVITSDGQQTVNCVARALVNSLASNSIYRIESLQPGQNYFNVKSVSVSANAVVGVTNVATIRSISSPPGGHGSNVFSELYCHSVGVTISLNGTENGTIPVTNDYQQIGILNNPLFANVQLGLTSANGNFTNGEIIYLYHSTQQLASNVVTTVGSNTVTCNNANFINQLQVNQYIIITTLNQGQAQLVQVANVNGANTIQVSNNALFSCSQSLLSSVTLTGNATIIVPSPLTITNCTSSFVGTQFVIGAQSGATGTLISTTLNGVTKPFTTFISMYKYTATQLNGTFIQNETITQGNTSASLFSVNTSGGSLTLYLSNLTSGPFVNGVVIGANSGASANITQSYLPDIIYGSGNLLYIENINPVTRQNNQMESYNIILSF